MQIKATRVGTFTSQIQFSMRKCSRAVFPVGKKMVLEKFLFLCNRARLCLHFKKPTRATAKMFPIEIITYICEYLNYECLICAELVNKMWQKATQDGFFCLCNADYRVLRKPIWQNAKEILEICNRDSTSPCENLCVPKNVKKACQLLHFRYERGNMQFLNMPPLGDAIEKVTTCQFVIAALDSQFVLHIGNMSTLEWDALIKVEITKVQLLLLCYVPCDNVKNNSIANYRLYIANEMNIVLFRVSNVCVNNTWTTSITKLKSYKLPTRIQKWCFIDEHLYIATDDHLLVLWNDQIYEDPLFANDPAYRNVTVFGLNGISVHAHSNHILLMCYSDSNGQNLATLFNVTLDTSTMSFNCTTVRSQILTSFGTIYNVHVSPSLAFLNIEAFDSYADSFYTPVVRTLHGPSSNDAVDYEDTKCFEQEQYSIQLGSMISFTGTMRMPITSKDKIFEDSAFPVLHMTDMGVLVVYSNCQIRLCLV